MGGGVGMGVLPLKDPNRAQRPRPTLDRGPKAAAALGAGPAGDRRRLLRGLGAAVPGIARLVGPE